MNSSNGCYMLHIYKYYCAVVVMSNVSCVVSLSLRIAPVLLVLTSFSSTSRILSRWLQGAPKVALLFLEVSRMATRLRSPVRSLTGGIVPSSRTHEFSYARTDSGTRSFVLTNSRETRNIQLVSVAWTKNERTNEQTVGSFVRLII